MGRPKGTLTGKCREWSVEQKLIIIHKHLDEHVPYNELSRIYSVNKGLIHSWIKRYLENGQDGLIRRNYTRDPSFGLLHRKSLSREEQLELENFKLRVENARLKKGYLVKGAGAEKEFVSISDMNIKSSKN